MTIVPITSQKIDSKKAGKNSSFREARYFDPDNDSLSTFRAVENLGLIMSKERIDEIAKKCTSNLPYDRYAIERISLAISSTLQSLPEFKDAPKTAWLKGAPNEGETALLKYPSGDYYFTENFREVNYTKGIVVAHTRIPPYVRVQIRACQRIQYRQEVWMKTEEFDRINAIRDDSIADEIESYIDVMDVLDEVDAFERECG